MEDLLREMMATEIGGICYYLLEKGVFILQFNSTYIFF